MKTPETLPTKLNPAFKLKLGKALRCSSTNKIQHAKHTYEIKNLLIKLK